MKRIGGIPLAFGAAAISGFAVFINAYGVRAIPDATVYTTAKNLVAAVILVGLALAFAVSRGSASASTPTRPRGSRSRLGLLAVGVIGGSVPFVLFFEGLSRASSTHAAFLHKTLVIWVALLAVPLLGEKLKKGHVAAIALLAGGLLLIEGGLGGFVLGPGELLVLAATLLWSVEVVVVKKLLASYPAATIALARMGLGALALLAWTAVTGRWAGLAGLSSVGWAWALLTGAILAGYVSTWYVALSRAAAIDVTAVLVVGAVLTGLLNALVKGVSLPAPSGLGMVLLVCGAAVIAVSARQPQPVPVRR